MDTPIISIGAIAALGFGLGTAFGLIGARTHFCTLGAISDILNIGSWTRMRMWLLAIGVAMLGVWALEFSGLVSTERSLYAGSRLPWLSHVLGGLLFGVGMTLASGCTSKTLIRLGGGNLKSVLVFLVVGISGYMTLKGLFGVWRAATVDRVAIDLGVSQELPALLAAASGLDAAMLGRWLPLLIGLAVVLAALASREMWRDEPSAIAGGVLIGLIVVGGWYVTGHIGFVEEHPETLEAAYIGTQANRPESLSLVAPFAYTLELLMFWSDKSRHVTFGIATALGMVAGALVWAIATRSWREEVFPDATDFHRHLLGGVLMGVGGVTALGCTVGQGLSGLSTLSLGSFITTAAIIVGCVLTMKFDLWRMMREA
jgi:uncharacterized membrane protein YedE/YeeE